MKSNEIDALVKDRMANKDENIFPVYDGIVNEKKYYKSKFKILWILKEPHGEGNWDMKDFIGNRNSLRKYTNWTRTFNPIIYITYSILNKFISYDEMFNIHQKPEMIDILQEIAFINLKKVPGTSISQSKIIKDAYEKYKDIILLQIETCSPDIIICGGTMSIIAKDLGIEGKLISMDSIKYYQTRDKIYIDALHPNQRGVQEDYCNDIIITVKNWVKKIKLRKNNL